MKIPHTINSNYFKEYLPSEASLTLVPESQRKIKSEDVSWDEFHPLKLTELCVKAIVANFENDIIIDTLPCWDRNFLMEILPTDLPLALVNKYVHHEIYWKRKVHDRWKDSANYCQDFGFDWKRMFMERHVQEAVEAITPEGFDLEYIENLCNLVKDCVKNLNLRELQIKQNAEEAEDEFDVQPEPSDHIDLSPIITGLVNLTELHLQFGLKNVGSDYKKSLFNFSLQDCRNLGEGVAKAKNLKLLRLHSSSLDDERTIALLSSMEQNCSLEKIDFSNCLVGDDGATAVARFMKNRSKLTSINLSNNKIGEEGISALAFMITQSYASPIENLNLKFNMFGDAGFKYLASALVRENVKLKILNVSCCDLGEKSGIFLGEVLNRNSVITDIDISNNHLGESSGRALEAALKVNKTIQCLDIRMTEIPDEQMLIINHNSYLNRIRALKGEKGVEREKLMMNKRAEEARQNELRAQEASVSASAKEEAEKREKELASVVNE